MKILITGGNGFIGKNLIEYLNKKEYQAIPIDIDDIDLTNEKSVDEFFLKNKFDFVIHTAIKGGSRKSSNNPEMIKENLKMFFNIAKNHNSFKKMIFLGSGAEYDKSKDISNAKEEDFGKNIPEDDYGFFKYACSKYIEKNQNIINLRVFGVFGKYEDYKTRFISNIICRIIFNLPVEINQNAKFDYISILDLCRIIEYFIINESHENIYNIGSERHFELIELANIIKNITGVNKELIIKNPGMNKEYTCDNTKLLNFIKGFNFTPIENSIKELYEYYLQNKDNIKKEDLLKI